MKFICGIRLGNLIYLCLNLILWWCICVEFILIWPFTILRKKNAALAMYTASDTQRVAYEDIKRKLEYVVS